MTKRSQSITDLLRRTSQTLFKNGSLSPQEYRIALDSIIDFQDEDAKGLLEICNIVWETFEHFSVDSDTSNSRESIQLDIQKSLTIRDLALKYSRSLKENNSGVEYDIRMQEDMVFLYYKEFSAHSEEESLIARNLRQEMSKYPTYTDLESGMDELSVN